MRFRIDIDGHNWLDLVADDVADAHLPLVHVFRDDELDEFVRRIVDAVNRTEHHPDEITGAAIIDVLRNHGT